MNERKTIHKIIEKINNKLIEDFTEEEIKNIEIKPTPKFFEYLEKELCKILKDDNLREEKQRFTSEFFTYLVNLIIDYLRLNEAPFSEKISFQHFFNGFFKWNKNKIIVYINGNEIELYSPFKSIHNFKNSIMLNSDICQLFECVIYEDKDFVQMNDLFTICFYITEAQRIKNIRMIIEKIKNNEVIELEYEKEGKEIIRSLIVLLFSKILYKSKKKNELLTNKLIQEIEVKTRDELIELLEKGKIVKFKNRVYAFGWALREKGYKDITYKFKLTSLMAPNGKRIYVYYSVDYPNENRKLENEIFNDSFLEILKNKISKKEFIEKYKPLFILYKNNISFFETVRNKGFISRYIIF